MRISTIDGVLAELEADGLTQRASIMLVPHATVGDYVLVHAGYALTVIEETEAEETLRLFAEIEAAGADEAAADAAADAPPAPAEPA